MYQSRGLRLSWSSVTAHSLSSAPISSTAFRLKEMRPVRETSMYGTSSAFLPAALKVLGLYSTSCSPRLLLDVLGMAETA